MGAIADIVFQFGEFKNESDSSLSDFLINLSSALVGTGTALWVFYLTSEADKRKREDIDKINIFQKMQYFTSLVESVYDLSRLQSEHIKVFYENQLKDTLNIPMLTYLPSNNIKRLSELNKHDEYFNAYVNAFDNSLDDIKQWRNLLAIIDFLNEQTMQIHEILRKSIDFDFERKTKYKEIVEEAMDKTASLFNDAKNVNKVDEFATFLNQSLIDFYDKVTDYSDLSQFQSLFVDPVKAGIIEKFMNIDSAVLLIGELKKATFVYTQIKYSNNSLAEDFKEIYKNYKTNSIKLEKVLTKLVEKF